MHTVQDSIKLAREFGSIVQEQFVGEKFRRIVAMNRTSHTDDGICATHDFCDANELMFDAFRNAFGRDPLESGHMSDSDMRLWNDAWAIAKAAEFFA